MVPEESRWLKHCRVYLAKHKIEQSMPIATIADESCYLEGPEYLMNNTAWLLC